MRENGKMIKLTAKVNTTTPMVPSMKAIGEKISSTGTERRPGLMELVTKENTRRAKRMASENSFGLMALPTRANLSTIIFMVWESILGLIKDNTMVNGLTTRCMEKEYSPGLMAESTMASTMMIKSKDMVFSPGLMVVDTKATGLMASSTVKAYTTLIREKSRRESGKMVRESDGSQKVGLTPMMMELTEMQIIDHKSALAK
jgi:hypothetical protein